MVIPSRSPTTTCQAGARSISRFTNNLLLLLPCLVVCAPGRSVCSLVLWAPVATRGKPSRCEISQRSAPHHMIRRPFPNRPALQVGSNSTAQYSTGVEHRVEKLGARGYGPFLQVAHSKPRFEAIQQTASAGAGNQQHATPCDCKQQLHNPAPTRLDAMAA